MGKKEKTMGTINNKIFILHGWTYSTEKWNPLIDLIKKNGFEVEMLNVPGLTEKIDKPWNINDYVEWLKQKIDNQKVNNLTTSNVADAIKQFNNKVILIGHSNGGRIALNFAIKHPEKLEKLILIDSAGIYRNNLVIRFKRMLFKSISKVGKKFSSSQKLKNILYKIVGESDYKNANPIMKQTMLNLINSDKSLSLNKVTVPTLIIWGENDQTTPLSDGKLMNKLIKNSKLNIVDNAKHSPMFTHTSDVAEIIIKNLNIENSMKIGN
ncbi:MAG: hypothetical protein A3E40_00475 [Candidatus Levybacteria bacterium RIFCSPHIGHO2_12_FULL_37_9]|nr:MAG: hypothetical protein A3E40_00475 [Candidatus Levybacteria bacterium RIFCSPHIGHO2_12_FULL_37_9]